VVAAAAVVVEIRAGVGGGTHVLGMGLDVRVA